MKWKIIICCFFIFFLSAKTSTGKESGPRKLKNMEDLRNSNYASHFPRHGLMLIFWFARNVHINQNGVMTIHYHRHIFLRFRNAEGILPDSSNYHYMGNLNRQGRYLPYSVTYNFYNSQHPDRNRDRLIIHLRQDEVTQIFVTAHHLNRGTFDPDETYEISAQLIQEIRNNQYGPFRFLRAIGFYFRERINRRCPQNHQRRHKRMTDDLEIECDTNTEAQLDIKSTENGCVKITWEGIPDDILSVTAYIGLYKDADSETTLVKVDSPISKSGELSTMLPLNPGLQLRLIQYNTSQGNVYHIPILNGSEFDDANRVPPTEIKGYKASLQLYTKDRYACARLYIEKSFTDWTTAFHSSWVGFYTSEQDDFDKYKQREPSTKFTQILNEDYNEDYDIYEYQSKLSICPGVQARFMLNENKDSENARTVPWEAV